MAAARYAAQLAAALAALVAAHMLLLPATTSWAGAHGVWGWALWTGWVAGSLAALRGGVLTARPAAAAIYGLHACAVTAVVMAIAAPGGWARDLAAVAGAALIWAIAFVPTTSGLALWHRMR
jgi:hypothetical protein